MHLERWLNLSSWSHGSNALWTRLDRLKRSHTCTCTHTLGCCSRRCLRCDRVFRRSPIQRRITSPPVPLSFSITVSLSDRCLYTFSEPKQKPSWHFKRTLSTELGSKAQCASVLTLWCLEAVVWSNQAGVISSSWEIKTIDYSRD